MSIHFELTNFNDLVHQVPKLIVLNDLPSVTKQDRDRIEQMTTLVFHQTDVFSNEPHCECERTTGGYNLGMICPHCQTPVCEVFSKELIPRVWIRNPVGVNLLINPLMWTMLSDEFTLRGFNTIEWLCNTDYQASGSAPEDVLEEIFNLGIRRGYNNFVSHFDEIIAKLWTISVFAKKKDANLEQLIRQKRDSIFSPFIPLPNKALLIREDTNVGNYQDIMLRSIVNAIQMIRSIDTATCKLSLRQKENRTAKTISQLAEFYYECYHQVFAKKTGLIRRNIAGTRCFWSTRGVISSITRPHVYDELEMPWGQAVTLLTVHLKSKMFRLGFTPNEMAALMYHFTNEHHEFLEIFMRLLIEETPDGRGLPVIFVRNPSLSRGSTQRFWIKTFKKDPRDMTIGLPILCVVMFNADFDGDQMSASLLLDNNLARQAEALAPHRNILDTNQPRTLTGAANMPKPVASTINNWISRPSPIVSPDPVKRSFMEALAD